MKTIAVVAVPAALAPADVLSVFERVTYPKRVNVIKARQRTSQYPNVKGQRNVLKQLSCGQKGLRKLIVAAVRLTLVPSAVARVLMASYGAIR